MFMPDANMAPPFDVSYQAYSISMMPNAEDKLRRGDVDNGGKIFLPPSALQHLTRLNTTYPMLFKLTNQRTGRETHCGVLEFEADEGNCYLPYWMMRNLLAEEGTTIQVESASLPVATFALFQPQTSEFQEITDQKAMLEQALRNFACLTVGDMIGIRYNEKLYELLVMETRPAHAVTVIECDLHTEFSASADYVPPMEKAEEDGTNVNGSLDGAVETNSFIPFVGMGNRLDGKTVLFTPMLQPDSTAIGIVRRGIPDYEYEPGTLIFARNFKPTNLNEPMK